MAPKDKDNTPAMCKECIQDLREFWFVRYLFSPRRLLTDTYDTTRRSRNALSRFGKNLLSVRLRPVLHQLCQCATWTKAFGIFIALFGTLYLLDKADPFGLSRTVQSYSEGLFQKVTSSFYEPRAQDRIAVVLIDQQTLDSRGESWPPRYTYYEEVVRRIAKQEPAAIFLDILVEDRRTYDDSLGAAQQAMADTLAESGVPLYLASLDNERRSVFAEVPGTQIAFAGWSGYGRDYPLLVGKKNYFNESDPDLAPTSRCSSNMPATAAFQLYRSLCARGLQSGCPIELERNDVGAFCNPLVIQWGRNVSKLVEERQLISASQCVAKEASWIVKLGDSVTSMVAALFSGVDRGTLKRDRQTCPYAVTIREEDLASEKARGVLQGRVVLIGSNLNGIHDLVESPIHGEIPGVYLHAMALDNLLNWNADYYQRSDSDLELIIAVFVLSLLAAALIRAKQKALNFLLHVVAILMLLLIIYCYHAQHRPPVDWLGFLLVFELIRRMLEKNSQHAPTA